MKFYAVFYDTLIYIALACAMIVGSSTQAHSARSINTVTLNGSNTVSVSPAQTVTVAMEVTVSDNGNSNRWYATYWEIGSESGCIIYEEAYQDKTATEIFTVTVPSAPGTYSGIFTVYGTPNCNSQQTTSETLNNAITVEDVIEVDYHFDESGWTGTAGEVQDSSGNDFHATAVNGPLTSIVSPAIPGNPGTCSYGVFDGENDYVALPPTYPDITKSYTITAWIRTQDNTRSGQRILIDDPNNSRGFGFSLGDGGTGRVRFFSRNTSPIILDTDNVIKNGNWYFVAAVANLESKIKRIYVFDQSGNKITDASGSYTGDWGFDDGDASMGGENDASGESSRNFHFEGDLDEIRVHEGALSETAISEHQNRSRFCFSQAAEYRFDLCSETNTVIDDSGNGFNGTVLNGPLDIQSGAVCNAGYFDGVDDYVVIDDRDAFDGTSALTITGWINPENIRTPPAGTNARGILSKRNNASSAVSYGVFFYSSIGDGKLYVDIDTVNDRFASSSAIQEDVWTHFAVVFNGKLPADERVKLYLNGKLDRTASESSTTIPDYNSNLYIGNLYYGTSQLKVFQGMLDEIRIVPEVLSEAEVQDLMKYTRPGCQSCSTIDHIRIEHTGVGLTCQRSDVVLRACADALCTSESTDSVTVTMTPATANPPTWVDGDEYTFTGFQTVQLRQTTPGTVVMGLANPNPAPTNGFRCYDSGVVGDCELEFFESGFIFDVPDLTSCQTSANVSVQAVQANTASPPACVADAGFANVTKSVKFWSTYDNPGIGTEEVALNGTDVVALDAIDIADESTGTSISLDFDVTATANINVRYPDAGQMQLNARYDGIGPEEADLVMLGSNGFITRPVGLCVYSDDANADCISGDGSCSAFKRVDEIFNLKVKGVCWEAPGDTDYCSGNSTTQNFQLGSIPISHNLIAPSSDGVSAGTIGVSLIDIAPADNGEHLIGNQTVSEVGVFTFTATPPDYFGTSLPSATSANIGRFTPDHFVTSIIENGAFQDGCSGFTYSGQSFSYSPPDYPEMLITATDSGNNTTVNYRDDFVKLTSPATQIIMPAISSDASRLGADMATLLNLTWMPGAVSLNANDDGTLDFSLGPDIFTYTRESNALIQPFTSDIQLPINTISDSDGITATDLPRSFAPAGTEIRYGRLQLENAYGPETLALTIPVFTEFYNGTSFVRNDLDNCTAYDSLNTQLSNFQGNLTAADTFASGGGFLVSGLGNDLFLEKPGVGNEGSTTVTLDISPAGLDMEWLQFDWDGDGVLDNPTAKATFGIFKGNQRLIYMRESIW